MGEKRQLDVAVISDVHLGTYGCQANELVNYLKSIQADKLILNGDIINIWQFNKHFWLQSHMEAPKEIMEHTAKGTEVYYLSGNHNEMLRKFSDFSLVSSSYATGGGACLRSWCKSKSDGSSRLIKTPGRITQLFPHLLKRLPKQFWGDRRTNTTCIMLVL